MKFRLLVVLSALFITVFFNSSNAEVRLPILVSDGMVLQRNADVIIWGWASPDESVSISFLEEKYIAITNDNGEWNIKLSHLNTGGPYKMTIVGNNTIEIKNVMVGDVWVCSGQSNMELTMDRISPLYPNEIKQAQYPAIRYFQVPKTYHFGKALNDFESGEWLSVNPEMAASMSAISYFFGKELHQHLKVPIGLINTSLGGSPAEAWLSEEAIKQFPKHYEELLLFKKPGIIDSIQKSDRERINSWYAQSSQNDAGNAKGEKKWHSPTLNDSDWEHMNIPGYWKDESIGAINGVLWFRKNFELSSEQAAMPANLLMGRIVDADSVFINGIFVGRTTYQYPPRRYNVPSKVLKEGKNNITVRVISNIGNGGFVEEKPYELAVGDTIVPLSGTWNYKVGTTMPALQGETFIRWKPVGLYNAMLNPLLKFSIKGAIWYQGESNADNPDEYAQLLPAMINDWRSKWQQGDFPFIIVQLPNFMKFKTEPSESNWARTREAQAKALKLPNTGLVTTIDIGEWNDIHPLNKADVGKRLVLQARHLAYNETNIVHSGPIFKSMKIRRRKIKLTFENSGKKLICSNNKSLQHFAIAGSDKQFVWANAKIKGKKVIVWSKQIKNPLAVRYAWSDNPGEINFYNEANLPATPFRTDKW